MRNCNNMYFGVLLFLFWSFLASPLFASAKDHEDVAQMGNLTTQNMLLEEKVKQAKLLDELKKQAPPGYDGTVATMDRMKAQNILLEEQARQAKLLEELQKSSGHTVSQSSQNQRQGRGQESFSPAATPAVSGIIGVRGRLYTRILLPSGVSVKLSLGDVIPGTALTICSISIKGVQVRNLHAEDSRASFLPFAHKGTPTAGHFEGQAGEERYYVPDSTVGGIQ